MAAIDQLLKWAKTSERMHQIILARLLRRTDLLSYVGITGKPTDLEIETQHRLYDFTITLDTGQRVHAELKVNSNLGEDQIQRQVAALKMTAPEDILAYFLVGTAQFVWNIHKLTNIATANNPNLKSSSLMMVDSPMMQAALHKILGQPLYSNDDRDLTVVYLSHLQKMDRSYEKYKSRPLFPRWDGDQWFGFYNALNKQPGIFAPGNNMFYVPNPRGGFFGFAWHRIDLPQKGVSAYLQLEESKLCLKVYVENPQFRGQFRDRLSGIVLEAWQELRNSGGITIQIQRPSRFGSGEYMTVAEMPGDYRCNASGRDPLRLDLDYAVAALTQAQNVLDGAVRLWTQSNIVLV